jgi:hypothetical protein
MGYELKESTIEVPKNTGIDGFLHALKGILKLPRVQEVKIDGKGQVSYKRYIVEGEEPAIGVDYEGLEPWNIIRNGDIVELWSLPTSASSRVVCLMDAARSEQLYPTAFVTGANSSLADWFRESSGVELRSTENLCGLKVYEDRSVPDSVLILCAAYTQDAGLVDTVRAYKVDMDYVVAPDTVVEVM